MPRAVQEAALEPVLAALPQGLNTRLGETGAGLSGGEARRVLLARAVFSQPDVILADEPTADLDAATADLIAQALLSESARGATLIVATHDMRLARCMDRIITLGGGRMSALWFIFRIVLQDQRKALLRGAVLSFAVLAMGAALLGVSGWFHHRCVRCRSDRYGGRVRRVPPLCRDPLPCAWAHSRALW